MRNFEIKNNQNGRSMIEMLGVLAIIGVLSVGGIAGYSKAMMKYRINKTIEQITLIAGNLRSFTASQPADRRYAGLCVSSGCYGNYGHDGKVVRKAKLVPDEMLLDDWEHLQWGSRDEMDAMITNAFGGPVQISNNELGSDSQGDLTDVAKISFYAIPEEACIDIASQDWSALDPEAVCVNIEIGMGECSGFITDVQDAINKCDAENNMISFVIK